MILPSNNVLAKLWQYQSKHRAVVFDAMFKQISSDDLRLRQEGDQWSIEELARHILNANEWWFYDFLLEYKTPSDHFNPIGVANESQAAQWASEDEIRLAYAQFDQTFLGFLADHPDPEEVFDRPQYQQSSTLTWVVYHLLQHEAETWGMAAERARRLGYLTPWDF